jgi:hypothetical protein
MDRGDYLVGASSSAAGICDAGDPDAAGVADDWQAPEMSA